MDLLDRILDKLRDWMKQIAEVLGGATQPQPQEAMIPIPVRDQPRRR